MADSVHARTPIPASPPAEKPTRAKHWRGVFAWFDSNRFDKLPKQDQYTPRSDPVRWVPYVLMHAGCLLALAVGFSWTTFAVAAALYLVRAFGITGVYHRYFSHRTYRTSRFFQFVLAVIGNAAMQRGPLWWAAQHRNHHKHSDDPNDPHSPHQHGLYWAHMGWLTDTQNMRTDYKLIPDLTRYRELLFIDRFEWVVPVAFGALLWGLGALLGHFAPQLGTSGPQMFVWCFFVSTVLLFHATCTINSLAHVFGGRRFKTTDTSRNNLFLAILTLGEGWHNNHHHYPSSARNGFYWWEIDITYYVLRAMAAVGLIWGLRPVPEAVLAEGRAADASATNK